MMLPEAQVPGRSWFLSGALNCAIYGIASHIKSTWRPHLTTEQVLNGGEKRRRKVKGKSLIFFFLQTQNIKKLRT